MGVPFNTGFMKPTTHKSFIINYVYFLFVLEEILLW